MYLLVVVRGGFSLHLLFLPYFGTASELSGTIVFDFSSPTSLACCSALRQSSIPCARMEMAQSVEALASHIDSRTRVPVWSPQLRLRLVGCCQLLRDRGMCLLYRAMAVSRIRVPRIQIPRGDRQTVGRLSPHRTHLWRGLPDRNVKGSAEHCKIIRVQFRDCRVHLASIAIGCQ